MEQTKIPADRQVFSKLSHILAQSSFSRKEEAVFLLQIIIIEHLKKAV